MTSAKSSTKNEHLETFRLFTNHRFEGTYTINKEPVQDG